MKPKTQRQLIESHLNSGKSITPMEALERYGCFRLAAIIWKIRQKRHVFTTMVKNRYGHSFAKYSFTPSRSSVHGTSTNEQYTSS